VHKSIRLFALAVLFAPLAQGQSKRLKSPTSPITPFLVDFPSGSSSAFICAPGDFRIVGAMTIRSRQSRCQGPRKGQGK